ncbi:MAG TPA: iron chelate uptake ABC transporter family permease subunit, partial [Candidatus Latescibacteria bacterium]|nr:iron chelate uptake ABC transporter family permease subunit [Candidatus Latescibacterota bacterium]
RVWGLLMGDVLLITNQDLVLLAFLTLCLAIVFVVFWKQFLFVSFDLDGARAFGINADRFNYLLFALIGLSSALLVKAIGSILVFAMLSAPAATALLISDSVKKTLWWSFSIAFVAGILALVLSYFTALSVSAIAAFLVTTAYFAVRIWRFASAQ